LRNDIVFPEHAPPWSQRRLAISFLQHCFVANQKVVSNELANRVPDWPRVKSLRYLSNLTVMGYFSQRTPWLNLNAN
jgi:hypothetical protein